MYSIGVNERNKEIFLNNMDSIKGRKKQYVQYVVSFIMVTLFIVNRYFQFFVFTEKYWDTGLVIEFREILAKIINRKIPSEKKNMLNYQKVVFTSLQQIIGTKL